MVEERIKEFRLAFLMKKLGTTNKELAEILHVDYSLISKWRNNKRSLRQHSTYVSKMTAYFLTLDAATHYSVIKEILTEAYPQTQLDSLELISALLGKWIVNNTTEYSSIETGRIQRSHPGVSYSAHFDVYLSNAGRREAIRRFHDLALSLPPGQELLLLTQEDFTWLIEDDDYRSSWQDELKAIINNGHHITIIHTMDLDFKYLFPIDTGWIPIHMTGLTSPRYFPKYVDTMFEQTMFIIKNKAVLTGLTAKNHSKPPHTLFFSDLITVQEYQTRFEAYFTNSRPLFEKYTSQQTSELAQLFISAEQRADNSYFYTSMPLVQTASAQTFHTALLEKQIKPEDYDTYIANETELKLLFDRNLNHAHYRHIIDVSVLEEMPASESSFFNSDSNALALSIDYITALLAMLDEQPNYEIALITNDTISSLNNSHLWVKKNALAIISTQLTGLHTAFSIATSEPTAVNAFYQYFDEFWLSIPRIHREKMWVREKLNQILDQLKNNF
ncbi:MAG: helix-turn-helix domain-containing protein [Firmicutes bacterium]|nr:helix-turn-helix domain-containing protein [Bacillota bacterium]